MPTFQILAYPVAGMFEEEWPSYGERGSGYTLDLRFARWALENYLPAGHEPRDPYLFPLAADVLSGDLEPHASIMTAEFDPLRDEGIALAERLAGAGVDVEHIHASDQMHGFLLLDRALPKAGALIDRLADSLAARANGRVAGGLIALKRRRLSSKAPRALCGEPCAGACCAWRGTSALYRFNSTRASASFASAMNSLARSVPKNGASHHVCGMAGRSGGEAGGPDGSARSDSRSLEDCSPTGRRERRRRAAARRCIGRLPGQRC